MSRIGRKPIAIPEGVTVTLNGAHISVKGPKGTLERELHKDMLITIEENNILVNRPSEEKMHKALHGLTRTLISNMVEGVTKGFAKALDVNGVGFRVQKTGKDLIMNLGFSHQVIMSDSADVTIEVPAPNKIIINGIDKQKVGQFASEVRSKRPPEPYKGKGIKYADEVIRRKEGKTGGKKK